MQIGVSWRPAAVVADLPGRSAARPAAALDGTRSRWRRWLTPSIGDLLFAACLCVAIAAGGLMLSADGDPGRHLTVGEQILSTGAIPRQDLFSHTMAGQPFVPYEWLSEALSAASYRLDGPAGPVLLHGAAIGLSFVLLLRTTQGATRGVLLALLVTLLAVATSTLHWLARPHVFTFLGTALFSWALAGWYAGRLTRRHLWLLAPAMALWANAHGGFLIGFILLGAYLGADALRFVFGVPAARAAARRRLLALVPASAATFCATLLNPAGPALWLHVTGYLGKSFLVDHTQEYLSPSFHESGDRLFLYLLLGATAALVWSRRRLGLHEGLLLIGFTYFALYSARNIPLYAIVVAPILAAQMAALPAPVPGEGRLGRFLDVAGRWLARRNAVYTRIDGSAQGGLWPAIALGVLVAFAAAQWRGGAAPLGLRFDPARQPVAAAAFVKANPPAGRMFNELRWGGYLLHEVWPAQQVFIDGQTDFYGEALTRDYVDVVSLESGWEQLLDRYQVSWVIYPTDTPLVRALATKPGWRVTYVDKVATVLERSAAQS